MKLLKIKLIAILIILLFILTSIPVNGRNNSNIFNLVNNDSNSNDKIFDLKMKILMRMGNCPSISACIIKNDSVVWSKGYGLYNLKEKKVPSNDTIYMLGSTTKPITATAIMILYEDGIIDLDEDVNNWLSFNLRNPNYPDTPLTFRMLLLHSTGLADYSLYHLRGFLDLIKTFPSSEKLGDWIKQVFVPGGEYYRPDYWRDCEPGTEAHYSNFGFAILGYLIEQVSNQTLDDFCQENIFQPLKMYNTSFHPDRLDESQLAVPYINRLGRFMPLPQYDPEGFAAIGGLRTTVEDLSHFLIAHMNNGEYDGVRVLENETVEEMHKIVLTNNENKILKHRRRSYGLGWFSSKWFGDRTEGHGGMCPGFVSAMVFNRTSKVGFIMCSNQFNAAWFVNYIKFAYKFELYTRVGRLLLQKAKEY